MRKTLLLLLGLITLISCNKSTESTEETLLIDSVEVVDSIPQPQRIGIKMTKSGGVYEIPCLVNGIRMNFIFDTGASNVSISLTEALFLYKNGYIDDEDIGGKTKSVVADGSIKTNTKPLVSTKNLDD